MTIKVGRKIKYHFICTHCQTTFPTWQGQCQSCKEWNALVEVEKSTQRSPAVSLTESKPISMQDIQVEEEVVIPSKINEFDRVLGKGFVKGSVLLLGGEPGIGKSTIALQIAQNCAKDHSKVLYITGEESVSQVYLRAQRTGENHPSCFVYSETNMSAILKTVQESQPTILILDSIQVVYRPELPSVPGSVSQVRQCASDLITLAKSLGIVTVLIGHITKDGDLAGPKTLEHLVDVILYLEGERNQQYRLLRSFKNRYSTTREIGIFEMKPSGLVEVSNPSALFIDDETLNHPGSMVTPVAEGDRVLLIELQALVVDSGYGHAKRTFLGVDQNRANLMIAAIEKILGLKLSTKDIILNIIGGLKINEPALDLPLLMAILSSFYNLTLPGRMGVVGEVGLTGEIRPVPQIEHRLKALEEMGFKGCVLPEKNRVKGLKSKLELHYVSHLSEAVKCFKRESS